MLATWAPAWAQSMLSCESESAVDAKISAYSLLIVLMNVEYASASVPAPGTEVAGLGFGGVPYFVQVALITRVPSR